MTEKKEIVNICSSKGFLIDKKLLEYFQKLKIENVKKIIEIIFGLNLDKKIINKKIFDENIEKFRNFLEFNEIYTEKKIHNIKVLSNNENISRKVELNDFITHFKSRFEIIKSIFETKGLENLSSIRKIGLNQSNYTIIASVLEKRITKNKNLLIEIEDLTGKSVVLVNKENKELIEIANELMLDDIVAFKVNGTNEMLFANDIIFPDCYLEKEKFSKDEIYVAFTGDFHVGSYKFLEKELMKFISWLNCEIGDERQKYFASKIKYLFLLGDNIDGVGIYQGQDEDLSIKSCFGQYNKLEEILKKIRKDIQIIICPGQHDAVWVGEQQFKISEKWAPGILKMENVVLIKNPSLIKIEDDFKILIYHGAGINRFIDEIQRIRINFGHLHPSEIQKEMLKRRHLAPTHGLFDYIPDKYKDEMVISEVPDIFVTGDQHVAEISNYNNISLISTSCWQSKTDFEEKMGNIPEPCKVPILNLKTREIKIIDFSGDDLNE